MMAVPSEAECFAEKLRTALSEIPSEEAQARHLGQIALATEAARATHNRLTTLESFKAQAEFQIMNLAEQMRAVIESQKREDTEAHKALRRSILALALAEVLLDFEDDRPEALTMAANIDDSEWWSVICAEVYRRYGGPELGLWLNPPDHVSDKTKALVKLFLQRRQEA